tara:strand:+ start:4808 stop:4987 length:180 start_codon:yes stop_codon:yes gene_type:complete
MQGGRQGARVRAYAAFSAFLAKRGEAPQAENHHAGQTRSHPERTGWFGIRLAAAGVQEG